MNPVFQLYKNQYGAERNMFEDLATAKSVKEVNQILRYFQAEAAQLSQRLVAADVTQPKPDPRTINDRDMLNDARLAAADTSDLNTQLGPDGTFVDPSVRAKLQQRTAEMSKVDKADQNTGLATIEQQTRKFIADPDGHIRELERKIGKKIRTRRALQEIIDVTINQTLGLKGTFKRRAIEQRDVMLDAAFPAPGTVTSH
jgi:hypothetical protein